MLGTEGVITKTKDGYIIIAMTDEEARRLSIEMLKDYRSRLKALLPKIKHTVRHHQATKKYKLIDYTLGRMIFFDEDFRTALRVAKERRKAGLV